MSDLIEKVRAAIDAAPWVERRDSFGTMHDTRAEARAAILEVVKWGRGNFYDDKPLHEFLDELTRSV